MKTLSLPPAFLDHLRAVQAARSHGRGSPARPGALEARAEAIAAFRANAMHLDRRLPGGRLADAAYGGLQDTAPRAALMALAARVEAVGPAAWEHPSLVQIWFRQADYLAPRADVGVFTRGAMPRPPERARALEALADAVLEILAGAPKTTREITPFMPGVRGDVWVRSLAVTGKLHIRWDARYVHVLAAEPPAIPDEAARLELARRFLSWLGPANAAQFAKWAGVSRPDAEETWRGLRDELIAVSVAGRAGWLLASDEAALRGAEPPRGVRFLPMGDPYLYAGGSLELPGVPAAATQSWAGPGVTSRLLNSLVGRVLLDGRLVASWGRVAEKVTIAPWAELSRPAREAIDGEAQTLGQALGRPVRIRWLG